MMMGSQVLITEITPGKKNRPKTGYEYAGDYAKPGIELLGHNVLRSIKRHSAKKINTRSMRRGDNQAE